MTSTSVRRQRARLGGLATAASHDSREITLPAREAFLRKFVDQVDPERVLSEDERMRRAGAALRGHMARLALRSSRTRTGRAGGIPRSASTDDVD